MNNNFKYLVLPLLLSMVSCSRSSKIDDKTQVYVNTNFDTYSDTYREVQEWLNYMIKNKKKAVTQLIFNPSFEIDKLILFNESQTKCIGAINFRLENSYHLTTVDFIRRYQGVKIENKWYYFMGGSLVIPRERYKYDPYKSLSFEELSYLARTEFLYGFYTISDDTLEENHEGIDKYITISKGIKYPDGETDDNWVHYYEYVMKDVLSESEISKIKSRRSDFVPKKPEITQKLTWWDKLKGKKPPLFEREEWKNRDKN